MLTERKRNIIVILLIFIMVTLYLLYTSRDNSFKPEITLLQSMENTNTAIKMAKDYEFRIKEDLIRYQIVIEMMERDVNVSDLLPLLKDSVSRSNKVIDQYSGLNIKNGIIAFDNNKTHNQKD